MNMLGVYKIKQEAFVPSLATRQSACYDISACLVDGDRVQYVTSYNEFGSRVVTDGKFTLHGGERALIPTGLIFDVPAGYSLRLHPRSGVSFKKGIALANCEGVIDSDYVEQTFVSLINHSDVSFVITHGDRIAQMELVITESTVVTEIPNPPVSRTNRMGGFGSTGLNV